MSVLVVVFLFVTGLLGCQNGNQDLNQNLNHNRGSDLSPANIANNNRGVGLMGRFEYDKARQLFAQLAEQQPDRPHVNLDVWLDVRVNLAIATRNHPDVYLGVSPRGSLALYRTSQALAAIRHRDYIIPDDVKFLAEPTLAHRLIISPAARIKNVDPKEVIQDILASVPVPGARVTSRR